MNRSAPASLAFWIYSLGVILFTLVLIWWGITVTTLGFGMAVPDWPQSYGSINPPGWVNSDPLFWEHGHRLIASLVGFLTLGMFGWRFARNWKRGLELLGIVALLTAIMISIIRNQYPLAILLGVGVITWLVWSWRSRDWDLLTKLTGLALLLVSLQAFLGGIRVLQISDTFGVIHGCLAQGFFCLLILISMASRPSWLRRGKIPEQSSTLIRRGALALVAVVAIQLILGATMRHHHRYGIADTGIFTTGEHWFPGFGNFDLLVLFLHKWWACAVLGVSIFFAWKGFRPLASFPILRNLVLLVLGMVLAQMVLGLSVIVTGKSFYVTNFHVVNGLGILATSFMVFVTALRAEATSILLTDRAKDVTMDAKQVA